MQLVTRYQRAVFGALAVASVTLLVACGEFVTGGTTGPPRQLTQSEAELVRADNAFAFRVFQAIADSAGPDSNLFISPLSASMALGMAYNGAAGTTQAEMQHALALEELTLDAVNQSNRSLIALLRGLDSRVAFNIANSVWYRQGFTLLPDFLSATRTYFDATVQGLDFSSPNAAPTINSWVSNATQGKIPTIVPDPIPNYVVAYLVNAIYFKGSWVTQFAKSRTGPAPFYLRTGSTASVPTMSHGNPVSVRSAGDGGIRIVDLPYGASAFSMTILLPRDPKGIDSLVPALSSERWSAWTAALDAASENTTPDLYLPKFVLTYGLSMNGVLRALGMRSAFDCNGAADFTRMAALAPGVLCISDVRHKATVDVNEEGTEAAAATSVEFAIKGSGPPPPLRIDRPFVFMIRERYSGAIVFMGRVMNPAVS
jgi:serine protease inhibitor